MPFSAAVDSGVLAPPPLRLVVATGNPGKAREFGRLLGEGVRVEPLPEGVELPEEVGLTFAENAASKANAVFRALGGARAVLADDSGLEVRALGGAPGVRSARFAGERAGDRENIAALLRALEGQEERSARFVCHLVLRLPEQALAPGARLPGGVDESGRVVNAVGYLSGSIAAAPRGEAGFGYDPVFRPLGWARTLGEAEPGEKDRISHRARAVLRLREELESLGMLSVKRRPVSE